ncbi:phage tail protein [Cellulomonas sp. Root485]|jgi:phage tail-like protein|uniref:Phage tail-like protein n=2 Tax=Cellulomonas TaxID=1707 RepID=A0ABU0EER0_9CELL|nr:MULTISPECIES: phage tail protein [Cellulomonas]KQR16297.1 phage tail protein [Cellulomonas sp. Leaf334]KQY25003.1 phage tail protein [Cellulomonas sp. Root485]MDQ0373751.1 phage tail-like protein [Cellulomonas humilata]GEK19813.1 phage tail protein [Cellulomonas xylanilytica]
MPIGEDALANYAWQIEVDGITLAQFKEVSGLSIEVSVIEHQENKPKGIPVMKKLPAAQKFSDITLKRGMTTDKGWWAWVKEVQEGKIDKARRGAAIVLYDYERGEKMRFNITNAWPSKISIGSLQAGGSEVTVEEVTLVHEGLAVA